MSARYTNIQTDGQIKKINIYIYTHTHTHSTMGYAVAQLVEALLLQAGRSRVRFPIVSLEFIIDTILPASLWPRG